MLEKDRDKDFLIEGIGNGFQIVDKVDIVKNVYSRNYNSVLEDSVKSKAEAQIRHELDVHNYVECKRRPQIVSSLGAIAKDNGKIRLIHDCSRPNQFSVNSYATTSHFKYQTVDDAVKKPAQKWLHGKN